MQIVSIKVYEIFQLTLEKIEIEQNDEELLLYALDLQTLHYLSIVNNHQHIGTIILNNVLHSTCIETESYLQDVVSRLKTKKYHYGLLYCLANNMKSNLDSTTTFKVFNLLVDFGIVIHLKRGVYKVADPLLKLYLSDEESF